MMELPLVVQGAQPFYLPAGRTGCLVLHGFSANPEEMRWLGDYLYSQGHTILGVRLAGHGTDPHDLARTRWTDWLIAVSYTHLDRAAAQSQERNRHRTFCVRTGHYLGRIHGPACCRQVTGNI